MPEEDPTKIQYAAWGQKKNCLVGRGNDFYCEYKLKGGKSTYPVAKSVTQVDITVFLDDDDDES